MINLRPSAFFLIASAMMLRADFHAERWAYRRPVALSRPAAMARIQIDSKTYQLSGSRLADLRVLRDGVETPFVLETLGARHLEREYAAPLDRVLIPGRGLQLTVDLGRPARHNQVRIETAKRNFKERVEVSASDDGKQWAIVRDDGSIFDESDSDRPSSSLLVNYPPTNRRYVRLTIPRWHDMKAVQAMWVNRWEELGPHRETILSVDRPAGTLKDQRTTYDLDLGFNGRPHDQVVFQVAAGLFLRNIEVMTSSDKVNWVFAGSGVISRNAEREGSSVEFPEDWRRYLRIELVNHDDQALVIERIEVRAITRELRFPAGQTGQYWLYLGNDAASRPVYDLASVLPSEKDTAEPRASLGAEQPNPAYKTPEKPLSDRYPMVLYALLGISILGMGYLAIRLLQKVQSQSAKSD